MGRRTSRVCLSICEMKLLGVVHSNILAVSTAMGYAIQTMITPWTQAASGSTTGSVSVTNAGPKLPEVFLATPSLSVSRSVMCFSATQTHLLAHMSTICTSNTVATMRKWPRANGLC